MFSVLLFPLAPLFYYFWKTAREEEMIQPNFKLSLSAEEQANIRASRKAFKEAANSREDNFFTHKEEAPSAYESETPAFVTKYKNVRDKFFLERRFNFFVPVANIRQIKENRAEDHEERLLLGLR